MDGRGQRGSPRFLARRARGVPQHARGPQRHARGWRGGPRSHAVHGRELASRGRVEDVRGVYEAWYARVRFLIPTILAF